MFEAVPTSYTLPLPANFLPAALPVLQNGASSGYVPLVFAEAGTGLEILPVAEADLADPEAMRTLMEATRLTPAPAQAGKAQQSSKKKAAAIGIIDTGLAFWNPLFAADGAKGFAGMGFLGFDPVSGSFPFNTLGADDLSRMVAAGATPSGDRKIRTELGQRFPHSVYGPFQGRGPLLGADAFSHGTAMADLVAQEAGPDVPLFGLELPSVALLDSSGWTLQGLLDLAIRRLVGMMRDKVKAGGRIVVLVAFAFLGGPQEGENPILTQLSATLKGFRASGQDVTLVVPTGNHLNQRAHAVLPATQDMEPSALKWRIMPDDHSPNTLDLLHHETDPVLVITAPDGRQVAAGQSPVEVLRMEGAVVGAVLTEVAGGGLMRSRITLAPTAGAGPRRAPAGLWRVQLSTFKGADAWIIRDDTTLATRRLRPFRQSRLEDLAYRERERNLWRAVDDYVHPTSRVRRQGTISLLASGAVEGLVAVGADWSPNGVDSFTAPYSGQPKPASSAPNPEREIVGEGRPYGGQFAAWAGSRARRRVNGTSVAAAIHAGKLARR